MNISFLIPTKDGGEGFEKLLFSIIKNVEYAKFNKVDMSYDINILINGDSEKPLKHLSSVSNIKDINIVLTKAVGKVSAINDILPKIQSKYIVVLDDDIYFNKDLLYLAIKEIEDKPFLSLVSFQTRVVSSNGLNTINKFFYDTINIRSLKKLYKGIDPFLFGRFLFIKKEFLIIPNDIINDDLYLGIFYEDKYVIRPEKVYYIGEFSIKRHIKRVLRLEAGRRQIKEMFGNRYNDYLNKNKREIDKGKVESLSLYYKLCYYSYKILRVLTNSVITRFFKHKTRYW